MKGDQLLYRGKKTKSIWAQTLIHPRRFSNKIPLPWIEGNNTLLVMWHSLQHCYFSKCWHYWPAAASEWPQGVTQDKSKHLPLFKLIKPFTTVAMPIIDKTRYLQLGTFKREINSLSYQTHGNMRCYLCGPREVRGEISNTASFPVLPAHFAKQWITEKEAVEVLLSKYSQISQQLLGSQSERTHLFLHCLLRLGEDGIVTILNTAFVIY